MDSLGSDALSDALDALKRGEVVIVTDDARRENEGDLIALAEKITPETMNFMITEGRGLICVAMEGALLDRFGLARMSSQGDGDSYRTAFMESVDARHGITTGISAYDRARTVQLLVDDASGPMDISRPGHMFPLAAVEGGVLRRPGHTEAAVDLARLAGAKPAGVICEILNGDGTMAREDDLRTFAVEHGLKMISIRDIADFRKRTEKLISLESEINFPTDVGMFRMKMYRSALDGKCHLALVYGQPEQQDTVLARIHSECLTGDAFGSLRCDCGSQLKEAMQRIAEAGHGVLLYMRQEGRGIGLEQKIRAYALQEQGLDTVEANEQLGFEADERDYSLAAQMLIDLGVRKVRLITNNPRKIQGIEPYGLEVVERVSLILPGTEFNAGYLATKKAKLGHMM
ncbi:MAG TPA: bifunctional 3,4-dihydroxy-2-butanone-4-phosphate synthase/GTP cyclohydrolase II [Kiritimatiellia bacterium]|nr:bifunctional 3,4-dihydroxy-2-butanone-4-phosphate synthase/GTP cyclohydrolase II [Kiritimatiellia bacterium]